MSMLSVQISNLRIMARLVRDYDYREISRTLRDAADTIDELRARCQELQEKEWRTCHLVTESTDARDWPNNQQCDQCGEYVAVVSPEVVRYCPSCGRRIVE